MESSVMEIYQDTHSFHHSCARVRCFMLGLGNDSWALDDGERILLPGGESVAYPTCSKIVNLSVMENQKDSSYCNWPPGYGKPDEYSGK